MKDSKSVSAEFSRLEYVDKLNILDCRPEEIYNDVIELAAQTCDTPIALITIVDSDRQWFKSRKGLSPL